MSGKTLFRIMLPKDGTHSTLVTQAYAAGLPFTLEMGDKVVAMSKNRGGDEPALCYIVDFPTVVEFEKILARLGACLKLTDIGEVPHYERDTLTKMSRLMIDCGNVIARLLK